MKGCNTIKIQKFYDLSPIFIQNFLISFYGLFLNLNRNGFIYKNYRRKLIDIDKMTLEEKLKKQEESFLTLVRFAYNNSKFYKKIFTPVIYSINKTEDISKLPILEKETLRSNINDIFTTNSSNYIEGHTGGTTGKSLIVRFTLEDINKRMAILDHFKYKHGFRNLIMKKATFNGKHIIPINNKKKIFWRYNYFSKQMIYSSFFLSEPNLKFYVKCLNQFKPLSIDGFFSSILEVAKYIDRNNLKLTFRPIAIFPTSETVTEEGRKIIERVFNTKLYNQYASSEGAPFIFECNHGSLHMDLSSGIFENIGENSELLVTSFTTFGTPLIRYRIGDSIVLDDSKSKCECGNTDPIVKAINGRKNDFIYTCDGNRINSANLANGFKNIPNAIIKAQIIQHKICEVNIYLEIDKSNYLPEYDLIILKEFQYKLGIKTKINISHVNNIQRENSGKLLFIKNFCDNL